VNWIKDIYFEECEETYYSCSSAEVGGDLDETAKSTPEPKTDYYSG
jgi:hypothetical protein